MGNEQSEAVGSDTDKQPHGCEFCDDTLMVCEIHERPAKYCWVFCPGAEVPCGWCVSVQGGQEEGEHSG